MKNDPYLVIQVVQDFWNCLLYYEMKLQVAFDTGNLT